MDSHYIDGPQGLSNDELGALLLEALKRKRFYLKYQPIVSNQTGEIKGLEALLRLSGPHGAIPPNKFIPYAETSGLIDEIGLWVIEEVCYQAKKLHDKYGKKAPYLSLNVTMVQLEDPDFAEKFLDMFIKSGAPKGSIAIEVTESVFSNNRVVIRANLEVLRSQGFKILIDDFGTGYSTLVNLIHFPFDTIKIDKAFIDNIHKDRKSREVVTGIIRIAEALGKNIIVEGVEDEKQFWELMSIGAKSTQGFLFSKPIYMEHAENLISKGLSDQISSDNRAYYTLYVSRSNIGSEDITALVEKSRMNNLNKQLTGFLLFSNGHFMQYLEGSKDTIEQQIEKIGNDARHDDMRIVLNGWVTERLFPDWSMGFWSLDDNNEFSSDSVNSEHLDFSTWKSRTLDLLQVSLEPALCRALFLSLSYENECVSCVNQTMACFDTE